MWKDPTLQPAKLKCSWGYGLWLGRKQTSNAHLIGTRVGIVFGSHDSTSAGVRTRGFQSGGGHEGHTVAGRPADAAAGDAPTMTRHAVEQREVIVVPASSGASLRAVSGEGVSAPSNPVPNLPKPTVARAQPSSAAVESSHHPSECSGPGNDVPTEVAQAVEPTTKSHAPVKEHDESLVPKRQRTIRDALLAKSGITRIHSWLSRLRRTQLQTFAEI